MASITWFFESICLFLLFSFDITLSDALVRFLDVITPKQKDTLGCLIGTREQ